MNEIVVKYPDSQTMWTISHGLIYDPDIRSLRILYLCVKLKVYPNRFIFDRILSPLLNEWFSGKGRVRI